MTNIDQPEHARQEVRSTTADPRRWKALAVLALIQFMLVLDVTFVNVALPRISTISASDAPGWLGWSTATC
jgi:hypothetical protein